MFDFRSGCFSSSYFQECMTSLLVDASTKNRVGNIFAVRYSRLNTSFNVGMLLEANELSKELKHHWNRKCANDSTNKSFQFL